MKGVLVGVDLGIGGPSDETSPIRTDFRPGTDTTILGEADGGSTWVEGRDV